jgi:hypothetical protein
MIKWNLWIPLTITIALIAANKLIFNALRKNFKSHPLMQTFEQQLQQALDENVAWNDKSAIQKILHFIYYIYNFILFSLVIVTFLSLLVQTLVIITFIIIPCKLRCLPVNETTND